MDQAPQDDDRTAGRRVVSNPGPRASMRAPQDDDRTGRSSQQGEGLPPSSSPASPAASTRQPAADVAVPSPSWIPDWPSGLVTSTTTIGGFTSEAPQPPPLLEIELQPVEPLYCQFQSPSRSQTNLLSSRNQPPTTNHKPPAANLLSSRQQPLPRGGDSDAPLDAISGGTHQETPSRRSAASASLSAPPHAPYGRPEGPSAASPPQPVPYRSLPAIGVPAYQTNAVAQSSPYADPAPPVYQYVPPAIIPSTTTPTRNNTGGLSYPPERLQYSASSMQYGASSQPYSSPSAVLPLASTPSASVPHPQHRLSWPVTATPTQPSTGTAIPPPPHPYASQYHYQQPQQHYPPPSPHHQQPQPQQHYAPPSREMSVASWQQPAAPVAATVPWSCKVGVCVSSVANSVCVHVCSVAACYPLLRLPLHPSIPAAA